VHNFACRGGGRESGLGRINHFYGTLWGVVPPGTAAKTRPTQASEQSRQFFHNAREHVNACCFHFYYPPTGQSGDYFRWKNIGGSFCFICASSQWIMLARLQQCSRAAMGNTFLLAAAAIVMAALCDGCSSCSSHCSSQYELL
jgi:hypothetical protein